LYTPSKQEELESDENKNPPLHYIRKNHKKKTWKKMVEVCYTSSYHW
jgi:hypothetical protein